MVSSTYVIVPKKRKPDGIGLTNKKKNRRLRHTLQTKNSSFFGHFSNVRTLEADAQPTSRDRPYTWPEYFATENSERRRRNLDTHHEIWEH